MSEQLSIVESGVEAAAGTQFARDLRKMADLLDAHPEFGKPSGTVNIHIFPHADEEKVHAACAMRALGNCEKVYDGENFRLTKKVGMHDLSIWYNRRDICERVVVGRELVPAQPERTIPATPEHEREIVEWVCSPVLKQPTVMEDHGAPELVGVSQQQLEASIDIPF